MTKPFNISCRQRSKDAEMFTAIINQGIDAHLEGFTKSKFYVAEPRMQDSRLMLDFDRSELPILLRRLREMDTDQATQWADDIETAWLAE